MPCRHSLLAESKQLAALRSAAQLQAKRVQLQADPEVKRAISVETQQDPEPVVSSASCTTNCLAP